MDPKDMIEEPISVLGKVIPKPHVDVTAHFAVGEQSDEVADSIAVRGVGNIGKWMCTAGGGIANWGGEQLEDKGIREMINVIFVDEGASDAADAEARVLEAMRAAGFPLRQGHSSGYHAFIESAEYEQCPNKDGHAFSDRPFIESNTHGRIFGPAQTAAGWVSTAALSSEKLLYTVPPQHAYGSFHYARDLLVDALDAKSEFVKAERVDLKNAATEKDDFTTGDHDGHAVVVRRK